MSHLTHLKTEKKKIMQMVTTQSVNWVVKNWNLLQINNWNITCCQFMKRKNNLTAIFVTIAVWQKVISTGTLVMFMKIIGRCRMVSTDQADPICFYLRISWILMEWLWFYFFVPLTCCRASEASKINCLRIRCEKFGPKFLISCWKMDILVP